MAKCFGIDERKMYLKSVVRQRYLMLRGHGTFRNCSLSFPFYETYHTQLLCHIKELPVTSWTIKINFLLTKPSTECLRIFGSKKLVQYFTFLIDYMVVLSGSFVIDHFKKHHYPLYHKLKRRLNLFPYPYLPSAVL